MDARLVWTLALVFLNGGLLWPLLRRRPVIVPLAQPLAFLACEIVSLQWLFQGSWTTGARWTALACFVFVGCLLIQQAFGRRRWFVFAAADSRTIWTLTTPSRWRSVRRFPTKACRRRR